MDQPVAEYARAGATVDRARLLIVEDHAILREGLRALLELEHDLEVVGVAADTISAVGIAREVRPDLVISDIAFPGRTGIQMVPELVAACPGTRVLMLTAHNTEEYIRAALGAGAHGYVLKDASRADLLTAIRTVLSGQQYLSERVSNKVLSNFLGTRESRGAPAPAQVTDREREVLVLIARGQSNKRIAAELNLSVKTVEKHRANLMRKLSLHNAAAVTMYAVRAGLITADQVATAGTGT